MLVAVYLLLIAFFSLVLVKATDILIVNLKALAAKTKLGEFALTGLILAFATSLPEFFIGITSAFNQTPNLSLGNVIGANIANLSLVIGGAAFLGGTIAARGRLLRREIILAFLISAAPLILLWDRRLDRLDGIILLFLYGFYQFSVLKDRQQERKELESEGIFQRFLRQLDHRSTQKEIGWLFLGVALLLFSAEMVVQFAGRLAVLLSLPILLIGLILVSLGTTLPELILGIKAARKHQPSMILGDLFGSLVTNSSLILGMVTLICPVKILSLSEYLIATMVLILTFGIFFVFIQSRKKIERWEGGVLMIIYFVFALIEFLKKS